MSKKVMTSNVHTAAKQHDCDQCKRKIEIGVQYYNNPVVSEKLCEKCFDILPEVKE